MHIAAEEEAVSKEGIPNPTASDHDALREFGHFHLVGHMDEKKCLELAEAMLRQALTLKGQNKLNASLTLDIASGGGGADAGFMLGGTIMRIRRMGIAVTVHVMHEACSAAALILQYGSERTADADAVIMLHDFTWGSWGNADDHRRVMDMVNIQRRKYAQVLASRNTAGLKSVQWWLDNYMGRDDNYMSAQEALELGLLDSVLGLPLIPSPPRQNARNEECPSQPDSSPLLPSA